MEQESMTNKTTFISLLELNLMQEKAKKQILSNKLEIASDRLDKAEKKYYAASSSFCEQEKVIRSLAAKIAHKKSDRPDTYA